MPVLTHPNACRIEPARPTSLMFDAAKHLVGQRLGSNARGVTELVLPVSRSPRDQAVQDCAPSAYLRSTENLADLAGIPLPDLSAMLTYYLARLRHGETDKDEGTYLFDVAECCADPGVCPEADWPEDAGGGVDRGPELDPEGRGRPPPAALLETFDRVVDAHVGIEDAPILGESAFLDALEDSLAGRHYPVTGFEVGEDFERYLGGGHVFDPPAVSKGRHAMYLRGVRGQGMSREWMLGNSWGRLWGDAGYVWISTAYMLTARGTRVPVRAPH